MNYIHPSAIVSPEVEMGQGNYIGPGVIIQGKTKIGNNNSFTAHVMIGFPSQHRKVDHLHVQHHLVTDEKGTLTIGSNNVFREFVTVNLPFVSKTVIGSDCFLMSYSHVSHDSLLEDGVTLCNNTQIGGHCAIMKHSTLGLSSVISQYNVIGSYSQVGMGTVMAKPLIPFSKILGTPALRIGANVIGLERAGFSPRLISEVEEVSQLVLNEAVMPPLAQVTEVIREEFMRYHKYLQDRRP